MKNFNPGDWTKFFIIFGLNPLFIYIVSEVGVTIMFMIHNGKDSLFQWLNKFFYQPLAPGPVGSLLFALSWMLFCWLVGLVLYKKKIVIKV